MNFHALRAAFRPLSRPASRLVASLSVALILAACASVSDAMMPAKVTDGAMTNAAGMMLYTFDKDTAGSGKSVCNGPCVGLWPAFTAPANATAKGAWSIATRDDGTHQWAYQGKPLYTFARDAKPGDRTGDGFNNNIWHVARP